MVPTWTGAFEQDFAKFRGYAIRPWMPVLAGFTVRSPEASRRFITDYRRARNEAFQENFYGTMMALCHTNGLTWHAESGGAWNRDPAVFGEADQLAFLGRNDMPQGEFWYRETKRQHGRDLNRPQAMTAHIYGRRLAAAEAFTHMIRHWSALSGGAETRRRRGVLRRRQPFDLATCSPVRRARSACRASSISRERISIRT
jgi:hypothetical protein